MATRASNEKKQPTSSLHPPYFTMISEAISSLKEKSGSSQPAIAKYLEEKYTTHLPPKFRKMLSIQLKRFAKSEKLFKVKNSYKLSATAAKKPNAAGNATVQKVTTTTAAAPRKKVVKNKMRKADEAQNDTTKKEESKKVVIVDSRVKKGSEKKLKATKPRPKASPKKTAKSLKAVKTSPTKSIKFSRKAVAVIKARK